MSRIGKLPVAVPSDVNVSLNGQELFVKGKLGELKREFSSEVSLDLQGDKLFVKPNNETARAKSLWGLVRTLINNMVVGVSKGFEKRLEINGVGYRAAVDKNVLTLFLGFSHEIKYLVPVGIKVVCEKPTLIVISGYNKELVGQVAAEIRALRKPEPYKGKGIKYDNEVIRRKEGKKK